MISSKESIGEKQWKLDVITDARDIVPGVKAWRIYGDRVEEGVVTAVRPIVVPKNGPEYIENDAGDRNVYIATFGSESLAQTYQWKWWISEIRARIHFVTYCMERIEDLESTIKRWRKRIDEQDIVIRASKEST